MEQAAYERVYTTLKGSIESKKYDVGTLLPPEPELEKMFDVSRTTVRKAIGMLVRDGLIAVKQGSGTRVVSRKSVQSLNRLTSISESLEQKGHVTSLKSYYLEKVSADEEVAELLGIGAGDSVFRINRIKLADGRPICICRNYIREQLVPGIESEESIPHLYSFLRSRYGIVYTGHSDIISAVSAGFEDAQMLGVEPRSALLTVKRVCYLDNVPCEVDFVSIVADMYEFELNFNGN